MRTSNLICLLAIILVPFSSNACADEPLTSAQREKILTLLDDGNRLQSRNELVAMGEKALPVLWEECEKPMVSDARLAKIFATVAQIPGERTRFIDLAAKQLPKKMELFDKLASLYLIRETKSWKHAPEVAKLLEIPDDFLADRVAKTLAVIGTGKELPALEGWLEKNGDPDSDPIRRSVLESTERLRKRLAKEKKG